MSPSVSLFFVCVLVVMLAYSFRHVLRSSVDTMFYCGVSFEASARRDRQIRCVSFAEITWVNE